MGNTGVFQGRGDGMVNPFFSGAVALCDNTNLMLGTGFRFAIDDRFSSFYDFDIHLDYQMGSFYPVLEMNLVTVIDDGDQLPIADEGQDLFNFGASDASGETMLTGSVGARYRYDDGLDFGLSYQFPINGGSGTRITDWRITADMIFSFDI